MIPRIAWMHWSQNGPKMSWLRKRAVTTFERHNPSWKVNLIETPDDIASIPGIGVSHEADWTCWRTLAQHGGFVFDTDIVHVAPVPDEWLDAELCAQLCAEKKDVFQFAGIGSVPGNELMVKAEQLCEESARASTPIGWETFGIPLLRRITQGKIVKDYGAINMPRRAFCHYNWTNDTEEMWSELGPNKSMHRDVVGVHWYGGHHTSRVCEPSCSPDGGSWLERLAR